MKASSSLLWQTYCSSEARATEAFNFYFNFPAVRWSPDHLHITVGSMRIRADTHSTEAQRISWQVSIFVLLFQCFQLLSATCCGSIQAQTHFLDISSSLRPNAVDRMQLPCSRSHPNFKLFSSRYSIAKAVSICSPLCAGIQCPTKTQKQWN